MKKFSLQFLYSSITRGKERIKAVNIFFTVVMFCCFGFSGSAQTWGYIGAEGFAGAASYTCMAIDPSGTPYVAYSDATMGGFATVMKYNGTSWVVVGTSGFSANEIYSCSIAIDGSGTPYVAYVDGFAGPATVMKFNGTSWVTVGSAGFSAGRASSICIAIDGSGTPYVAYSDWVAGRLATVMKFNGASWVTVGSPGFTAATASQIGIAINPSGQPYISYQDNSVGDRISVMQFNGSSWVQVGTAGFSTGISIDFNSIAIDGSGTPYVAFSDEASGTPRGVVMKFNGTGWVSVGPYYLTAGAAPTLSVAINGSGTPYVAYQDGVGGKAMVVEFTGGSWATVGTADFSAGDIQYLSLALTGGVPYVAYTDLADAGKVSVMSLVPGPIPAITGASVVCIGATDTLSDAAAGGTWTSSATTIATVGSLNGVVTGVASGTTIITYIAFGDTVTDLITVNPLPNIYTVSGGGSICAGGGGEDIILSNSDAGVNYQVVLLGTGIVGGITAGTGSSIDLGTYSTAGTYEVVATSVLGCSDTMSSSAMITVSPSPMVFPITGGGSYCSTCPHIGLSGSQSGITYGVYCGGTIFGLPVLGTGGPIDFGTFCMSCGYVVIATDPSSGCSSVMGVDTVDSVGSASPIAGYATVCIGLTTDLTDATTGGTWSSSSTGIATVGSATGVVTGVSAGTATITYSAGGCTTTIVVTVPSTGAAPITGLHDLCQLTTETIHDVDSGYWSSTLVTVTNLGSGNALVTAVNPGIASVTYTLASSGCEIIDTLFVDPLPTIETRDSTICQGSSINYTANISGGAWSSSNGLVAIAGTATGTIYGSGAGTAIITYTTPAGCEDTTLITVLPLPTAISGSPGVCLGDSTILTDGTLGGVWSSSNSFVAPISSSTGVVVGETIGSATITYTLPTGCLTTFTITVNPLPSALTGPDSVCDGSTATLIESSGAGIWTSSNPAVGTVDGSGDVTGVSAGTLTITFSGGSGCYVTIGFTVDSLPSIIAGADSLCVGIGTSIRLSDSVDSSVAIWSSSNMSVARVDPVGLVTAYTAGTTVITYALPTGCYAVKTIKVDEAPGAIAGTTTFCVGTSTTLTDTPSGGLWYTDNLAVASIANDSFGVVSGVSVGTAIISYVLSTGCLVITSVDVTPVPSFITGTSPICQGAIDTLTDVAPGGIWASSDTSLATIGSSSGIVHGIGEGTVSISYTVGSCVSPIFSLTILSMSPIIGPDSMCKGATISLVDSTADVSDSHWSGGSSAAGIISITDGDTVANIRGFDTGIAVITYSFVSCTTTHTITVLPTPELFPNPFTLCLGDSVTIISTIPGGAWSNSGGITEGLADSTFANYVGTSAGPASVTYTMPTGCNAIDTGTVFPLPFAIIGDSAMCAGPLYSVVFTDLTAGGTWTSSSTTIVSVDSTTGLVTGVDSGRAAIIYTLGTGCFVTDTIVINPVGPILGNPNVCIGLTATYVDSVHGGTWSNDNPAVGTIDTTGIFTSIDTGTTNITYTMPTGCLAVITVTVDPLPDSITGNIPVCVGSSIILGDIDTGGTWTSETVSVASVGFTSGIVTGHSGGTVIITYTLATGCLTTISETVNPLPAPITDTRGPLSVCVSLTTILVDDSLGGVWTNSNPAVGTIDSIGIYTGISAGTSLITYTMPLTGCYINAVVTVYPPAVITVATPVEMCIGDSRTLRATSVPGASFAWSPAYDLSTTTGPTTIASPTVTTTYTVTATTFAGGCISDTTVTVLVDSFLRYIKVVGRDSICIGTCDTLMASGRDSTYFAWKPITALSCTICDTTIACPDATTTYIATAIDDFGCKDSVVFKVTVMPLPQLTVEESPVIVCRGTPKELHAFGAWSYSWTPPYFLSCDSCSDPIATDTFNIVYELHGATEFGCRDSIPVRVSVLDTNFNKAGDDTIICIGGSAQLNAYSHSVNGNLDVPVYLWLPDSGLNNNMIPDPIATPDSTTLYKAIITENVCFTDTIPVLVVVDSLPVIQITANPPGTLQVAGTAVQLNAIVTVDTVATYAWTPTISLSCDTCENPVATPSVNTTYNVVVTSTHGCVSEDTITIDIACNNSEVFIPNTFTPNGDGKNDLFYVSAKGITTITRMSIYNRWGQLVFQANNIPPDMPGLGWDGTFKGIVLEPDVFDYVIDVVCELGSTYEYTGNVSIVR